MTDSPRNPAQRLVLDGDVPGGQPLHEWLAEHTDGPDGAALIGILDRIVDAIPPLALRLAVGRVAGDPAHVVGINSLGDAQKVLDMAAHHHFLAALQGASLASVLSEEAPDIITLDPDGRFALAMDPVDGSASIGVGAPLGALFAIFPAEDGGATFRLPGRFARAAAYVSFGHSTDIGLCVGGSMCLATLDPRDGVFHITDRDLHLPDETKMIAINASNERHWPPGLQRYAEELRKGRLGPRGQDANMRWLAAAVGELHRILLKGGAFLYPADARPGYQEGRLRLLYEAVPIALMIEAAGGAATDGVRRILDIVPRHPHQNVPLCFGARAEIARIREHLTG